LAKHGANGQERQPCTTQQENFKKKLRKTLDWQITNFDRQAAIFNCASMEAVT
jgi:hypothetical protein